MIKKILKILFVLSLVLVVFFVLFVGPWPTYSASNVESESYHKANLAELWRSAARSGISGGTHALEAGWAKADMTPPIGTPLAGYGDRKGAPSTGAHDELYVKTLVLSDGSDRVAIVSSDMLIVPENVAEIVRDQVAANSSLQPDDILFNASHTHSGPGAWAPGFVGEQFSGKYNERIVEFLAEKFTESILAANAEIAPASIGFASADAPEYIRNRARDAATDSELSLMVVEKADKSRCYVVSYSAHATVLGDGNMEFSGDYPGYLQRAIERGTGGFAMFLGGATGSMSNRYGGDKSGFEKAEALGDALAVKALGSAEAITFDDKIEIASIGIPLETPSPQWRINSKWRASPYLLGILGIDSDGWFQTLRIGNTYLLGMPADFSGEISVKLKEWGGGQGMDLWPLSFNGDYLGYISPDEYYEPSDTDKERYEMYLMNWCGPNQEAMFTSLAQHAVAALSKSGE